MVCYYLKQETADKFPEHSKRIVGGHLFLRFICPAIVTPHGPGYRSGGYLDLSSLLFVLATSGVLSHTPSLSRPSSDPCSCRVWLAGGATAAQRVDGAHFCVKGVAGMDGGRCPSMLLRWCDPSPMDKGWAHAYKAFLSIPLFLLICLTP